ncbi:hypothetical protein DICVIV_01101 [Dictyocaulus viviparus]|uniref:Secreted protein n=1 Tax=Dictyocaulus viviparus TaxID=29172 RepID=A0A0D8Y7D0_DICVI|nr:hypothetical protein DICVIV_01101 [Dictyocaulus viviparus]
MIKPLLFSLAAFVPIVTSVLSSYQNSPLMNLLGSSQTVADGFPEWILQSSRAVKKYDRNCFFSPVQCMLTFHQKGDQPIIFTTKRKQPFYYQT